MKPSVHRRPGKDWPWYKVKAALEARGLTLADIARERGYSVSSAHKVKRIFIPKMQAHIAEALDEKPEAIWPTRYDRKGTPIRFRPWQKNRRKNSTAGPAGNVHSDKAA